MNLRDLMRLPLFTGAWLTLFCLGAQAQPPGGPAAAGPRPLIADARPVRSCESLAEVELGNTTIESDRESASVGFEFLAAEGLHDVEITGPGGRVLRMVHDVWIDGVFYEPLPGEWGISPPMAIGGPDLRMTKLGPPTLNLGQTGYFTLDVQNTGSSDAWNTTIVDRLPDGPLARKRVFCNMGSDGMTIDASGNVYLTGPGVLVFDPSGKQIEHIEVPEGWTANVSFCGRDRQTLFITASKGLYSVRTRTKAGTAAK